uniref:Doublecortin domain containing 2 n=1 Tax=Nothobranchius pienaari TaxID=704102 RepID=A0A1A8M1C8_9TELE
MSSDRPSFLSQPVVKNIFMFRNGDPYFEALTGGIQAPFGAVRTIYTPRRGHKVDCMESLQSGEQYVAAGKERFKKLDYLQIAPRKKKMMQTLPLQVKPLPPNRIIVSARFLKPIKEPCPIFVVANGDVLNPVLYVAVGRERFKKLPYSDLLFPRPKGTRRIKGMKAYSLPPIYRFAKQRGNSKSTVGSSDSGDGESKGSPQNPSSSSKERLSSAESIEKTEEEVETPENISEVDVSANMGAKNEKQETNMEEEEKKDADEQNDEKLEELKAEEEETTENEQNVVTEESKSQVNDEEQEPNSSAADGDQTEENKEKEHILNTPSEAEVEQDSNTDEDKQEKDGGNREESSNINDEESGEEQRETEISDSPAETRLENETKESANDRISSRSSIRDEDEKKTTEVTEEERTANGEVSGDTCPGAAVKPENAEEDSSKKEED